MASRKKVIPKKRRGRPATGKDPLRAIRMSYVQSSAIEAWAKKQADKPSWSEAVRRLVAYALEKLN